MVTELLQKYIWLIQTFIRAGRRGLDLKELETRWENRFGTPYARRSFNNHREAIEEVFNIRIECDRSTNRYFIRYSDDVSDENAASAWLINTFTVNNILSMGKERLSGRVSVEDIPSGHSYLAETMDAMLDNCEIEISYRKYSGGEVSSYTLRPYAVKEDAKRWYIVAFCIEKGQMRVYGMDRIISMKVTDRHFRMPEGFDADELFSTSYGVYLSQEKPEEIIFHATPREARYLNDLPLHKSQKLISSDGKGSIFSIFASPNENLVMDLFRLSPRIEIISPRHLREEIIRRAALTSELYGSGCTCPRADDGTGESHGEENGSRAESPGMEPDTLTGDNITEYRYGKGK